MNTKIAYEFLLVDTVSSDNSSLSVDYEILRVNLLSIRTKNESNGITFVFYFKDVVMGSIYRIRIFIHSSEYKDTFIWVTIILDSKKLFWYKALDWIYKNPIRPQDYRKEHRKKK